MSRIENRSIRRKVGVSWFSTLIVVLVAGGAVAVGTVGSLTAASPAPSSALPPEKQAIEDQYAAVLRAEAQHPAVRNPNWTPAPIAPSDVIESTIPHHAAGAGQLYDGPSTLPGQADFVDSNMWIETETDRIVEVYAGRLASEPSQGAIIVAVWSPSRASWLEGGRFLAPSAAGALRIIGASGTDLALAVGASTTTALSFDSSVRRFH